MACANLSSLRTCVACRSKGACSSHLTRRSGVSRSQFTYRLLYQEKLKPRAGEAGSHAMDQHVAMAKTNAPPVDLVSGRTIVDAIAATEGHDLWKYRLTELHRAAGTIMPVPAMSIRTRAPAGRLVVGYISASKITPENRTADRTLAVHARLGAVTGEQP
jgi:hypothetical protein